VRLVVADASALVEVLLSTPAAAPFRAVVHADDSDVHVPALCDVELASALRRALRLGLMTEERARETVVDYLDLPLTRHPHTTLLPRALALRDNFSAYDATYVALAERLRAELLTADDPLARAVAAHAPDLTLAVSPAPAGA
jgi:predicted nucleic acid-binding protein